MKKKLLFMIFSMVCLSLILWSCGKEPIDGPSGNAAIFEPEQREIKFSNEENSVTLESLVTFWVGQADIEQNGKVVTIEETDFKNVSGDWFSARVSDDHRQIVITVKQNDTGNERKVEITLQSGDYFESLIVTQSK
jgi:hypothetical protein